MVVTKQGMPLFNNIWYNYLSQSLHVMSLKQFIGLILIKFFIQSNSKRILNSLIQDNEKNSIGKK